MIPPLQKVELNGELYRRDDKIESLLLDLRELPSRDIAERAKISDRDALNYIPTECLVHLLRHTHRLTSDLDGDYELLYTVLMERVVRGLRRTASYRDTQVAEQALDRMVMLLALDRCHYEERLDFFEARFDRALQSLRIGVARSVDRKMAAETSFESDEGEPLPEVEQVASTLDPLDPTNLEAACYRIQLSGAIEALPDGQRQIIHMLRLGYSIDSNDPGELTIAKALGKSEKTIRLHRDKALATLREALSSKEQK